MEPRPFQLYKHVQIRSMLIDNCHTIDKGEWLCNIYSDPARRRHSLGFSPC